MWHMASPMVLVVKNLPTNVGDLRYADSILGLGRYPEGGHGNDSSILTWRTPCTGKFQGLQSLGLQRIGQG